MKYIANSTEFKLKNNAVTLGKFDGLHMGHRLLLNAVLEQKEKGLNAVMFTFFSHPVSLFTGQEIELLYVEEEKRILVEQMGFDAMISYPFTRETASMEPETFIEEVLVKRLDAKVIVVGADYCFGHKRRGNVDLLKEMAGVYGYKLIVFDKKKVSDLIVSSSYIREELAKGNMEKVREYLGGPFTIIGEVLHGRKIGRTLGFPTTNIIPEKMKLLPPNGVYASVTKIDGAYYKGLTNIGHNPTVGETKEKRVETYLFDYDQDLYGKVIEVALYSMEREEVKFDSVEELKEQMNQDIIYGKKYFEKNIDLL